MHVDTNVDTYIFIFSNKSKFFYLKFWTKNIGIVLTIMFYLANNSDSKFYLVDILKRSFL